MSNDKHHDVEGIDVLVLHIDALLLRERQWAQRLADGEPSSFGPIGGTRTGLAVTTDQMDLWQECVADEAGGGEYKFGLVGLADWRQRLVDAARLFDHVVVIGQEEDEPAIQRAVGHLDSIQKDWSVWIGDFAWHDGDHGIGVAEGIARGMDELARHTPIDRIHVWLRLDQWTVETVRERLAWRSERKYTVRAVDRGLGLLRSAFTPDLYLRRYTRRHQAEGV